MMRPPASASENRTHGAEKIEPSRYSDFFNKIGQSLPICDVGVVSVHPSISDMMLPRRDRQKGPKPSPYRATLVWNL